MKSTIPSCWNVLAIERNAHAKLKSVKGLGRSYSWESFVTKRRELPLLNACG